MRGVRDGLFFSEQLPPLLIRVAASMRYIGSFDFDLTGVAHVERHLFVEDARGTVTRMLVRPAGGAVVALARGDRRGARFQLDTLRGRINGYRS